MWIDYKNKNKDGEQNDVQNFIKKTKEIETEKKRKKRET